MCVDPTPARGCLAPLLSGLVSSRCLVLVFLCLCLWPTRGGSMLLPLGPRQDSLAGGALHWQLGEDVAHHARDWRQTRRRLEVTSAHGASVELSHAALAEGVAALLVRVHHRLRQGLETDGAHEVLVNFILVDVYQLLGRAPRRPLLLELSDAAVSGMGGCRRCLCGETLLLCSVTGTEDQVCLLAARQEPLHRPREAAGAQLHPAVHVHVSWYLCLRLFLLPLSLLLLAMFPISPPVSVAVAIAVAFLRPLPLPVAITLCRYVAPITVMAMAATVFLRLL
mmetsp:Transcript_7433/g.31506  ORF Transcript_7433/g.31506 Transcript_7433/m.31506 type:complete len:281 (-) Transcript_7433:840-1682(-)